MSVTFFSRDGSYGDAAGLTMLDTRHWSQADWERVKNATDDERLTVALRTSLLVARAQIAALDRLQHA